MKKLLFTALLWLPLLFACKNEDSPTSEIPESENEVDAARNFLRASLDGRWNDARKFMIQDSTNSQIIDQYEENYQTRLDREMKRGYREANITFYEQRKVSDSVVVVNYANTYMNKRDSLKLVLVNGEWLVDLKYSFFSKTPPLLPDSTKQ